MANPWDVVKTEPASDPWAVVSHEPAIPEAVRQAMIGNLPGMTQRGKQAAMNAGVIPPQPSAQEQALAKAPGIASTAASDIWGLIKGLPGFAASVAEGVSNPAGAGVTAAARTAANDLVRKSEGRSVPYRVMAGIGENVTPLNVRGQEENANIGNTRGVIGNTLAGVGATVAMDRLGNAMKSKMTRDTAALTPEQSARQIAQAVNPQVNEWNNYINATAQEAGNIIDHAKRTGSPLKTQLDYATVARSAADQTKAVFDQGILGPVASKEVSVPASYQGRSVAGMDGTKISRATLGDVNDRINAINNELRGAYTKREGGQVLTALSNEADLVAEKQALTDTLHSELAKATGLTPEQVANMRQRYGRMYSIADETLAAVNQRQSSMGKAVEGRRDIPVTTSQLIADRVNALRGGPEGIANRNFRKAIANAPMSASDLPIPSRTTQPQMAVSHTPSWNAIEPGRPNPQWSTITPEEVSSHVQGVTTRSNARRVSKELADYYARQRDIANRMGR